ncbi:hypothetical protein [Shewanella ulleungensis]
MGRYPHRNDMLGRKAEIEFLTQPSSSFLRLFNY